MEAQIFANALYEKVFLEKSELQKAIEGQMSERLEYIFSIHCAISDLFTKELGKLNVMETLIQEISNKKANKNHIGTSNSGQIKETGEKEKKEEKSIDSLCSRGAGATLKFNLAINQLYGELSEREKNVMATLAFDYLLRRVAISAFVNADEHFSYPTGRGLLAYGVYEKIQGSSCLKSGKISLNDIKIFLAKQIEHSYIENYLKLPNLNFEIDKELQNARGEKELFDGDKKMGYLNSCNQGLSRNYTLNLSQYKLAPLIEDRPIGVYSFYVDTGAYVFQGKTEIPDNPYKIKPIAHAHKYN